MKVFKFYTEDYHYACSGKTEAEAKEALQNYYGVSEDEIVKTEEIPDSEWDKDFIEICEDNDPEKEVFTISIREAMTADSPEPIFSNDPSTWD